MTTTGMLLALVLGCGGGPSRTLLQDKGSDTMVNLMQRMSEEYTKEHPTVIVAVTGGGSGTGIKALIDGTTDMANCSRPMSDEEKALAEKNGVHPHETVVAYDGLSIYVNKDNPIERIDFEQLKCIYGASGTCNHWSDLGVTLDCGGTDEIVKIGRQNNSGTYEYFREEVLGDEGKFTNTLDQSGTQQVVDVVGTSKCAIGYGGMGYHTESARFACLAKATDGPCAEPTIETVKQGAYVFARPLYVYTNGAPTGEVSTFLDWARAESGQKVAIDSGFVPLK
ncbi:MAG: PstS family phosphate ABC transporter substrate-binding protein [Myxococcota bacterium]